MTADVGNVNRQRNNGAALIEFALVLPLLLAVVVGILYYGYAFVLVSSAQNAARTGAEAAVGLDPLTPAYSQVVAEQAESAAEKVLDWLPETTVSVAASIGAPPAADPPDDPPVDCQDVGSDFIVVRVTILTNADQHVLLPTLSLGEFRIPPGLDSENNQPAVKASACAQL